MLQNRTNQPRLRAQLRAYLHVFVILLTVPFIKGIFIPVVPLLIKFRDEKRVK